LQQIASLTKKIYPSTAKNVSGRGVLADLKGTIGPVRAQNHRFNANSGVFDAIIGVEVDIEVGRECVSGAVPLSTGFPPFSANPKISPFNYMPLVHVKPFAIFPLPHSH